MDVVLVMEKQKKKDHVVMQHFHNFVEPEESINIE